MIQLSWLFLTSRTRHNHLRNSLAFIVRNCLIESQRNDNCQQIRAGNATLRAKQTRQASRRGANTANSIKVDINNSQMANVQYA